MCAMTSQITSLTSVKSTVYPGADQRKRQSCTSLALARGIHRWLVSSPHNGRITPKMFPFDGVIMGEVRPVIVTMPITEVDTGIPIIAVSIASS